jgi:hypothetical protein
MNERALKGKEAEFTRRLERELSTNLSEYYVTRGESLIYKFYIDAQGQLQPENMQQPKRGQLAFQTDLMIKKKLKVVTLEGIPLVVIEVKFGSFSTHDVLTYSAKATRHKEIYPYMRYGLVVGERRKIDRKFFTHNSGFDFALAIDKTDDLSEVTETVKQQAQAAERMLTVFQGREVKKYVTNIELTLNPSRPS